MARPELATEKSLNYSAAIRRNKARRERERENARAPRVIHNHRFARARVKVAGRSMLVNCNLDAHPVRAAVRGDAKWKRGRAVFSRGYLVDFP